MLLQPTPYRRGDSLEKLEGNIVAGIGALSQTCIGGRDLKQPLEVILLQGSRERGFQARLGDHHHHVFEGPLMEGKVSFTLESFKMAKEGKPLENLKKDSATFQTEVKGELQEEILNTIEKEKIRGSLLYVQGVARELHVYAHTDPNILNDKTKTFDHRAEPLQIEGWGNFSLVDGKTPFIHVHGIYTTSAKEKFGGHFIMDEKTQLLIEKLKLLIYPVGPLTRSVQNETFPTWKV